MGYGNPYSNIPPVPNGSNSRRVRSHAQTGTDGAFFVVNTSKLVTLFRSPPDNYSQLQVSGSWYQNEALHGVSLAPRSLKNFALCSPLPKLSLSLLPKLISHAP